MGCRASASIERIMRRRALKTFRRIVIKVGSSLLIDGEAGEVARRGFGARADIAELHDEGRDVLVVSSGSIALGRSRLKLPAALKLEDSQAAAAVGQIALARIWAEALGATASPPGRFWSRCRITEERRRYLNARATIANAAGLARRAGHQRERYGRDHRNPLRRQRSPRRPRRHHERARICWFCSPTSMGSNRAARRKTPPS